MYQCCLVLLLQSDHEPQQQTSPANAHCRSRTRYTSRTVPAGQYLLQAHRYAGHIIRGMHAIVIPSLFSYRQFEVNSCTVPGGVARGRCSVGASSTYSRRLLIIEIKRPRSMLRNRPSFLIVNNVNLIKQSNTRPRNDPRHCLDKM